MVEDPLPKAEVCGHTSVGGDTSSESLVHGLPTAVVGDPMTKAEVGRIVSPSVSQVLCLLRRRAVRRGLLALTPLASRPPPALSPLARRPLLDRDLGLARCSLHRRSSTAQECG